MNTATLIIFIIGCVIQGLFIKVEHEEKYVLADVLKGTASLMFVIVGFLGFRQCGDATFGKKIFIGLILGMIGDILLNLRFVFEKIGQKIFLSGIAAFLVGHILYLVALIPNAQHLSACVIIGVIAAAALLTYIFKTMEVKLSFKIFGVVYLTAVIVMCCIGCGIAIFNPGTHSIIYAIGAVLFTASDIVLIFNTFSGVTRFSLRITNLSLYYLGQMLIAICLFYC